MGNQRPLTISETDGTHESTWLWAWILVGWALALTILLLQSHSSVSFIRWMFGTRAMDFGLRVRSSALFAWMLLVLDYGIFFFFVAVQLSIVGLLFNEFHKSWGVPFFLWWLGQTVLGPAPVAGIWGSVAVRVVFLVLSFPNNLSQTQLPPKGKQSQTQSRPKEKQSQTKSPPEGKHVDARSRSALPQLSTLDHILLVLVGMTVLWIFPWPTENVVVIAPVAEARDPIGLLIQQGLLALFVLGFFVWPARNQLHHQISSIGASCACMCNLAEFGRCFVCFVGWVVPCFF